VGQGGHPIGGRDPGPYRLPHALAHPDVCQCAAGHAGGDAPQCPEAQRARDLPDMEWPVKKKNVRSSFPPMMSRQSTGVLPRGPRGHGERGVRVTTGRAAARLAMLTQPDIRGSGPHGSIHGELPHTIDADCQGQAPGPPRNYRGCSQCWRSRPPSRDTTCLTASVTRGPAPSRPKGSRRAPGPRPWPR
jgi:hypothetical protein